jgi:hypothetical protein
MPTSRAYTVDADDSAAYHRSSVVYEAARKEAPYPTRGEAAEAAVSAVEPGAAPPELPLLGSPGVDARLLRAGAKEALTGSVRTVDLMFRFGSKYRLRSADDGWELYKFTDPAYESRLQNNLKALGVELLFPFQ